MQALKIGGNTNKKEIKKLVNEYFDNSNIDIIEHNYEKRFEFSFVPAKRKTIEETAFYDLVSNLVQKIIIEIYLKEIIKDRVKKICSDYSLEEKEEIIVSTHSMLMNNNYYRREKNLINQDIIDYLIESNTIIIDGYMQFRLRKFLYIVDISIEKAIGDIEIEKEYLEFLNMLQYFIDIQEPKSDVINVIIKDDDYFLLNSENKIIEDGLLNDMEEDLSYDDISKADLLISSLIILSPNRLVVHIDEHKEKDLVTIISQIFKDRVEFCNGCDICKIKSNSKESKTKEVD